jgi:NADH dehydrogenase
MSDSIQPIRIVMLGGGYVSVFAYRTLAGRLKRQLKQGQVELIVVSPQSQHIFHGWTNEVLGGIIPVPHYLTPLRSLLKQARFVCGRALAVDLKQQTVQVALTGPGDYHEQLSYDHLVIGTGSYDQQESLPGLNEHTWMLKEAGSTLALRNHLLGLMEQVDSLSDSQERERLLSIVVAGGGFTGVEVCATIAEMLQVAQSHYPALRRQKARLVLIHSGQTLLPQYLPDFKGLTEYATQQLKAYGVDVRFETRLSRVTAEGAYLSDGSFIPSQTVISTVGQALIPLPGTEHLQRAEDERLLTDEYLHVPGQSNVWAGGDVASVIHRRSQRPCPANALWAIKHGERIGDNIARTVQMQPLTPFTYPGLGQAASLGVGKGAVELYGIPFTGWLGWLMRLFFFIIFMPSRIQAARVIFNWLTLPFFGRHFVPLRSPKD